MKWPITLLVAVAMSVAGIAFAAGGGSDSVKLCSEKKGGDLSLAAKGGCGRGAKTLTISKRGPIGPPGVAGKDGTPADLAPHAPVLVGSATPTCQTDVGRFCGVPGCSGAWSSYTDTPVKYQVAADGLVSLRGEASVQSGGTCGSGGDGTIFYLPPGFRPTDQTRTFAAIDCGGNATSVTVAESGSVRTPSGACSSFDGISFQP
jgi:hypothetical protein